MFLEVETNPKSSIYWPTLTFLMLNGVPLYTENPLLRFS